MRLSVAGLGLIGGSVCRAAKKNIPGIHITGFDADGSSLKEALRIGVIDAAGTPENLSSEGCDIFVVALPVKASVRVLETLLKNNVSGALVLDAGSVKGGVLSSLGRQTPIEKFVPCHPMAGSEKSGFAASSDGLFEHANVIITPHAENSEHDTALAAEFWESLGANISFSSPEYHDAAVAFTSHMPHIMSSSVALAASDFFASRRPEGESSDGSRAFIGRGFSDVTRLASGSPDVWTDICGLNRDAIIKALDSVIGRLKDARDRLSSDGGIRPFLEESVSAKRGFEMRSIVVAVDGPAGSGKSSVSKEVARKEGLFYIDSGAIYRSITWYMLKRFMSLDRSADYGSLARKEMKISQEYLPTGVSRTFVNGEDVSELIRNEKITANIGIISDNLGVREFVTDLLRSWAGEKPVIMDGRDIGTVVFPNADLKIYCDASPRVRAERRVNEYREKGKNVDVKEVESQIIQRDEQDRSRKFGALKVAEDAVILDTSELTKDQVVERFLDLIRKKRGA
jgi:cytidylate kinase